MKRTPTSQDWGRARDTFLTVNGPGPWPCAYCDELVDHLGVQSGDGNVHHVDEDPTNNAAENLTVMHRVCHVRHHKKGVPLTEEHRAKTHFAHLGHPHSAETKSRLSLAKLGRPMYHPRFRCGDCEMVTTGSALRKHQDKTQHTGKVKVS